MAYKKIKVHQLKPGMVPASDVYCPRSGVLLLKGETAFHRAAIQYLQNNDPEMELYINTGPGADLNKEESHQDILDGLLFDSEEELEKSAQRIHNISPEIADEETKQIYVQAYKALNKIYQNRKIKPYLGELSEVIDNLISKLSVNPQMIIQVALLRKIDNYYLSHSVNVCVFASFLGRLIGIGLHTLKELSFAGLMHDIGKLDISPEILKKDDFLTEAELESVKLHSLHSFFRLSSLEKLGNNVLQSVLQHHERLDGSGYPHGLKGDEIHLWGRILGIVDVFDAVTTERSYRNAVSRQQGLEILLSQSSQFDQKLLNLFIKNTSFYPIGCRVLLNTGEKGVVTGVHRHLPLRPIVRVEKKDTGRAKFIDLSEELTLFIERVLHS